VLLLWQLTWLTPASRFICTSMVIHEADKFYSSYVITTEVLITYI